MLSICGLLTRSGLFVGNADIAVNVSLSYRKQREELEQQVAEVSSKRYTRRHV